MPKKKTEVSKTAFVRNLPANMPAKEVSARARAAGLAITPGYVYEIRSSAKRAGKKASPKPAKKDGRRKSTRRAPKENIVLVLVREADRLGLERAVALLRSVNEAVHEAAEG